MQQTGSETDCIRDAIVYYINAMGTRKNVW